MRSLREVFQTGESIKALITDLDPSRGRIGLNTALLEGPPGELITDKAKVMEEAEERAIKARNSINKEKIDTQKEEPNKKALDVMAKEGASVIVNDLGGTVAGTGSSGTPADQVVQEIQSFGGTAVASYSSVSQYVSAGNIIQSAIDNFGRIDILCNAAGILRDRMIFNMEGWEQFKKIMTHF